MGTLEDAKRMARILAASFREKNVDITVGQSLEIVAKQFGSKDWNTLSATMKSAGARSSGNAKGGSRKSSTETPIDFCLLFPEVPLPGCKLVEDDRQIHPYPTELKGIPELTAWRERWNDSAISTRERPFFPPMIPSSSFRARKVTYELRRDWSVSPGGAGIGTGTYHFSKGHCCALAKDENGRVIGACSWKWWGNFNRVDGVGFNLFLLTTSGWLRVCFDLRGTVALPTSGPHVERDNNGDDSKIIQSCLRELSALDVFQYPDE